MDKLDELALLIAILDEGTLIAAAHKTGRSPASVTHILNEMETRIGVRLIERTTRKLAPTEAGRRLADSGRRILGDYDESLHEAMGQAVSPTGLLRVSAPLMFGRRHLAPIATRYLDMYPQVSIELLLSNEMVDLIDHKIDVALRIGALNDSRLTVRQIGEVRRIIVASPDYLRKHGLPTNPDSLAQHTLVMMSIRGEVQPWNLTAQAHSRFVVNQAETMIDAAISGIGLARPLSYQVVDEIKSGKLVRVLSQFEPEPIPVSLVFTSRKHIPMRTRAFLDIAVEALKQVEGIQYS
ncbi:HTH-type transcriptional regulator PgrR [mine drainage metagenome]|uniref:HTH-type transcriptional regulator PgrR n=1 Tax=mine drainage metagenome TaxID=410659 RepID=A0A1J5R544_9ZZZZ